VNQACVKKDGLMGVCHLVIAPQFGAKYVACKK